MGEEIQVPISVGWFSIFINNDSIILRETKVSRKAIWLLFSSMVKEMCGSIECMSVLWKESAAFSFMMQMHDALNEMS